MKICIDYVILSCIIYENNVGEYFSCQKLNFIRKLTIFAASLILNFRFGTFIGKRIAIKHTNSDTKFY